MTQTILVALPGIIALVICLRSGPKKALLDAYLPALLLLPEFEMQFSGQMNFTDFAIFVIALFLLMRPSQPWRWDSTDLLIAVYVALTVISETINIGAKMGENLALHQTWSILLPYYVAKQTMSDLRFALKCAKRIAVLLAFVAIVSVYEFRMGSDLFRQPFMNIIEMPVGRLAGTTFRAGWMRIQGPFGHAMTAGLMMGIGYCLVRWVELSETWKGKVPFLGISKVRLCKFGILLGLLMTISLGDWMAAGVAAVIFAVLMARDRKRAVTVLIVVMVTVGPPLYSAFKGYATVARTEAGDQTQEDVAYRNELLQVYIPVVEERPMLGWGESFPIYGDMYSIDNGYLLTALLYGVIALGVWVAILVLTPIRLCTFGLRLPRKDQRAVAAFALVTAFVIFAVCNLEGAIMAGPQIVHLFFLFVGWSAALMSMRAANRADVASSPARRQNRLRFKRVMGHGRAAAMSHNP